jgi:hypothetical protein
MYARVFQAASFLHRFLPKPRIRTCSFQYVPDMMCLSHFPGFADPMIFDQEFKISVPASFSHLVLFPPSPPLPPVCDDFRDQKLKCFSIYVRF